MGIRFRRKLYSRGGSFETTIPIQMLFSLDISKKHEVIFEFDNKNRKWLLSFEEFKEKNRSKK
jgi:hypothetical protein